MLRLLLAAALLAVLTLPVGASGNPIVPQLTANVTATSITLVGANGKRVRVLQPNLYKIVVHDRTGKQNFHLVGPSLNLKTSLRGKGSSGWAIVLKAGTFRYYSDGSPSKLKGSFRVR